MAAQGAAVLRTVLEGLGDRGGAATERAASNGHSEPQPELIRLEG
ncbi:MAG: hypothetical protein JWO98_4079 [Frankiales bacterium]|nr:hypothetical protein [Frankiales bacterium]